MTSTNTRRPEDLIGESIRLATTPKATGARVVGYNAHPAYLVEAPDTGRRYTVPANQDWEIVPDAKRYEPTDVDQLRRDLDTMTAVADSNRRHAAILTGVVEAAYRFADDMAQFCSPHGVATSYAVKLREALDRAQPAEPVDVEVRWGVDHGNPAVGDNGVIRYQDEATARRAAAPHRLPVVSWTVTTGRPQPA